MGTWLKLTNQIEGENFYCMLKKDFCSMLFLSDCMRNKKMCHPGSHLETVKEDGLSQDQHLQGKGAEQIT